MRNYLTLTALAFSLAAGLASAQTSTETPAPGAEAPAADSDPNGLSLGQVEGEVQVGQTYVREEHGDWELRCVKSQEGDDPCQLYQLLRDGEGNSVAEFNIFPLPAGGQAAAGANIITPLETLLTANLRLAIDGGQPKVYPYSFCSRIGCFARIGLTVAELDLFRKGAGAKVTIVPAASPDETVELSLSLTGFTAGYNALNAPAQ
jgi:invasion protein IalB